MGGIGRASGKLILFGEHAAVYGHPAVGVSLPEGTTVTFGDTALPEWDLGTIPAEDREGVQSILERLEHALPGLGSRGRCSVGIESNVARKAGFGSSAALCAAFARAALAHSEAGGDQRGDLLRAWALAHDAERIFHGTPSGVDTGLALLEGTCVLQPRHPGLPDFWKAAGSALHIVVGAVPRDAACAALVGGIGARMKSGDRAVRVSIDALGRIAAEAADALRHGTRGLGAKFGALAGKAMDQLRELGLSTPELDLLLGAARAAGALGSKLSGAGGGGAFFAIARDEEAASVIITRLESECAEAGIALASPLRVLRA
jgi:mevalonate kinase